jgi:hypothetical protein
MTMTKFMPSSLLVAVFAAFLLGSSPSPVDAASKVKRVKAGKVYQDHDAVHIVVNKVG